MNATVDPRGDDPERERMLSLLKSVVQREVSILRAQPPH